MSFFLLLSASFRVIVFTHKGNTVTQIQLVLLAVAYYYYGQYYAGADMKIHLKRHNTHHKQCKGLAKRCHHCTTNRNKGVYGLG